jgi:hypothetical protein
MEIPTPEYFREKVEEMIEKYIITDCIYTSCIEEFGRIKLSEMNEIDGIRIIRPFLFTWGQMQRWLGDVGVERVIQKLKSEAFAVRIEPLRCRNLQIVKLEGLKELIVGLFNELMETKFNSELGKEKHVNSTATSKVLHLCCPNLFIMWDRNIRIGYHKYNGEGEDYFQFLVEMKNLWNKLSGAIRELQVKYEMYPLRPTRIIDMYNFAEHNREK